MPKNLLLADDSITIQKVVGITFANEDYKVTAVDNGEEAIARTKDLRPDIILADVVMPRKNGYEVCEAVKSDPELRHIPVLLLAGTFEAFDEARARAVRADGHIGKPFESQALINRVNELVTGKPTPVQPSPSLVRPPPPMTGLPPGARAPGMPGSRPAPQGLPPSRPAGSSGNGMPPGGFQPRPAATTRSQAVPPGAPPPGLPHAAPPGPRQPGVPSAPAAQPLARPAPSQSFSPRAPHGLAPAPVGRPPGGVPSGQRGPVSSPFEAGRPSGMMSTPRPSASTTPRAPAVFTPPAPAPQPLPPPESASADDDWSDVTIAPPEFSDAGSMELREPSSHSTAEPFFAEKSVRPFLAPAEESRPPSPVPLAPGDSGEAALRAALSTASREVIERIVWEVVPQLAETIIRENLDRLVKDREG